MGKNLRRKNREILGRVLLVALLVVVGFLVLNLVDSFGVLDRKKIPASFSVSDHVGFDLNDSALTFGLIRPGNSASREMIVKNEFDGDVRVVIRSHGDISDFLIVSENDFVLEAFETRNIRFNVFAPMDGSFREYNGMVEVIFENV